MAGWWMVMRGSERVDGEVVWRGEGAVVGQDKAKYQNIRYVAPFPHFGRSFRNMPYQFEIPIDSEEQSGRTSYLAQLRIPLAALAAILFILACGRLLVDFQIGLSLTDSSSRPGLYRLIDAPIRRGELVAACLPDNVEREGLSRGYLRVGDCPAGAQAVLKIVGALGGDLLEVQSDRVFINGTTQLNSRVMSRDTANRPLPHVQWGRYSVASNEAWIFGFSNPRSWDSRYFGPVPVTAIRGVAEPLLTW
jgi:conjugative transfer signal peptidase TraF